MEHAALEGARAAAAQSDQVRRQKERQTRPKRVPLPHHLMKASDSDKGRAVEADQIKYADDLESYVSPESYARLVSKYSELEGHANQLSEQNRKQMHEIQTLRGSNSGFQDGTAYLHSRIAELEEQLSKTEVQMALCMDQRDEWQKSYEAEIQAKAEEAKLRSQLKAENRSLRNEQSQWTRLFQMANFRNQSETDVHFRYKEKCHKLEQAYERLVHQYEEREFAFQEHLKKVNGNVDQLTAHCSSLAKQSGLRRTYAPTEDESGVLDAFRQLNVAVRYWCLAVWDLKSENAELCFTSTPLARKDDIDFSTDEVWLLIACLWEWLMKAVFGVANKSGETFDLWMDRASAELLAALELRVSALQKPEVLHEWRSFTVQCLFDEKWHDKSDRMNDVVAEIMAWLLPMLKMEDAESEDIKKLVQELKVDVIQPAIAFAATLRKRYTPVVIGTPMTVDSAIRHWVKNREEETDLKIVTVPELRKVDLEADSQPTQYITIAEAQWYCLVEKTDEKDEANSAQAEG